FRRLHDECVELKELSLSLRLAATPLAVKIGCGSAERQRKQVSLACGLRLIQAENKFSLV
ncbi:MAG: hypothetical protein K2O46_04505, partial [Bacteroidales bacterium]|nr:hypothetical protein [Bacteroidales bacterium]